MDERMRILEQVEAGEISVEEAVRLLEALTQPAQPSAAPITPPAWVQRLWLIVFWSGVILVAGGGMLLMSFYAWEAGIGSAICGWPLLIVGVLGIVLGWWLERTHWFSLRIREQNGRRIVLAAPLPLGPIAWILRIIRPFVPQLRDTAVDEVVLALQQELREGHPFVVDVNEGKNGEQVQVYFG